MADAGSVGSTNNRENNGDGDGDGDNRDDNRCQQTSPIGKKQVKDAKPSSLKTTIDDSTASSPVTSRQNRDQRVDGFVHEHRHRDIIEQSQSKSPARSSFLR